MFGKKKKQAQLEAERAKQLALEQEQAAKQHPVEEPKPEEEKIFLESEIIEDDDTAQEGELEAVAYAEKQDKGEDLVAVPVDDVAEEKTEQQAETVEEVKCEKSKRRWTKTRKRPKKRKKMKTSMSKKNPQSSKAQPTNNRKKSFTSWTDRKKTTKSSNPQNSSSCPISSIICFRSTCPSR